MRLVASRIAGLERLNQLIDYYQATALIGPIYAMCGWLIRVAMLGILPLKRSPQSATSWLLLVFLWPIPGLILFLAVGRTDGAQSRRRRFEDLAPFFAEAAAAMRASGPSVPQGPHDVTDLATKLGNLPAVGGNSLEFLCDYDAMIDRLVSDIDLARKHVRIMVYIFADDATGTKVIAALARASQRGVVCNVLIDPVGSHPWRRATLAALAHAGVSARESLPVSFLGLRRRSDMRNHRKLFIIDGVTGYAGSQNLVDKAFRRGVVNQEMVVRVTGVVVAAMTAVFVADWYCETEILLEPPTHFVPVPGPAQGKVAALLLPSGAEYPLRGFETMLVWLIHSARHRVILTTPYFIPDEALQSAMQIAVARGVEVILIISAIIDQPLVRLAQCSYYDDLLSAGVRITCFQDRLLHAKNVSIDDRVGIVGSSNIDIRSFQLNEEVSLLLLDPASVGDLVALQEQALMHSEPIDLATWRQRSRLHQLGEGLARLVSPLL
jgi:cardiolipin synthase